MNRTSRKMTRTAVPASGTASVTHSRIAARKMPNMRVPATSRPGSCTNRQVTIHASAATAPNTLTGLIACFFLAKSAGRVDIF